MTDNDPFEMWKTERRIHAVSPDFADKVMTRVRAAAAAGDGVRPRASTRRRRAQHVFMLAAYASVILACQTALVGSVLLAMSGVAH